MSTVTHQYPQPARQAASPSSIHVESCCYPGEALCGVPLHGARVVNVAVTCVVCLDLAAAPCHTVCVWRPAA